MHLPVLVLAWLLPVALFAMRRLTTPATSGIGTHEQLGLAPCRFRELFGFRCPGCGVTTAVSHFAHGEPGLALATQPLGATPAALALLLPVQVACGLSPCGCCLLALRWGSTPTPGAPCCDFSASCL